MTIAGSPRARRTSLVAGAAAAAVVVAGALAAFSRPEPEIAVADGFGPGDGLQRYVVTLVDDAATPGPQSAPSQSGPQPSGPPAPADALAPTFTGLAHGRLDTGLLSRAQSELGPDGRIMAYGSDPYYVTAAGAMLVGPGGDGSVVGAGSLVAVREHAEPDGVQEGSADAEPGGAESVLASLAGRPGVESAQRLTDGTVLVATGLTEDEVAAFPEVAAVAPSTEVPVFGEVAGRALAGTPVPLPDDPYLRAYGWNLHNTGSNAYQQAAVAGSDVDALTGWGVTQGQGVVVAVVDTGFDSDHPDLAGSLWTNPSEPCGSVDTDGNGKVGDCHGWNFYANSADVDNGTYGSHGTSVSGVVGARASNGQGSAGVAPQVQLMPLVVGGGSSVDVFLAAEAIRYAADNGADVVNASFGGSFGGAALDALRSAVDYAIGKGVVVVAAAGNDAADRDTSTVYPASLENPALLTVASTTASDGLASHSAYGVSSVDLGAPGELVVTPWNDGGYRVVSGTSTAAPHVAAAAALHLSLRDLTPAQVRTALLADAEPVPALAGRTVSGGRLSVGPLASPADRIVYTFSGMLGTAGQQRPVVEVASTAPAGTYAVTFGLAMLVDGEVWAVSGAEVSFAGAVQATDDAGTATFSLGALPGLGTRTLEPVLSLGAGSFALTAQVLRDGEPLTRPYAAPLVVGAAASQPGGGGTTEPGVGGDGDPGTGGGVEPGTGGGAVPGDGGGTSPGGTSPVPDGGSPNPGGGGSTQPGGGGSTQPDDGGSVNPGGGGTAPGTSPGGTDPGGTDPGGTDGGGTSPGGTSPGGTTPGGSSPGGTDPVPGGGGTEPPAGGWEPSPSDVTRYDRVGAFAITQLGPVHVPAGGGTLVTVLGDALEPGVTVRVGATATADVLLSTTELLVFRTPARVPGTYDVTIARFGRSSVLLDALVYLAPGDSGGATQPGTGGGPSTGGGTDPGTGGGVEPGGGSTDPGPGGGTSPGDGTAPGGTEPDTNPGTGEGTGPGTGDSGDGAGGGTTTPSTTRTGPNGERLVRNDALAALAGIWSRQCATTCTGVQV